MRISDWSSDVCSSDLVTATQGLRTQRHRLGDHLRPPADREQFDQRLPPRHRNLRRLGQQIERRTAERRPTACNRCRNRHHRPLHPSPRLQRPAGLLKHHTTPPHHHHLRSRTTHHHSRLHTSPTTHH